jgi:FAD/FMN-containing dehydrogenase
MRIRSLAAEVYLFTVEKHDAATLHWALESLSELWQLNEHVINIAFNNEPPTFEQLTFIRKTYHDIVNSEGQPGGVKLSKESIEYLIKLARDHEHVRRFYQADSFLEMLERIKQ